MRVLKLWLVKEEKASNQIFTLSKNIVLLYASMYEIIMESILKKVLEILSNMT